ncbi:hypothetical protein I317_00604 [Kwoniella heveanensis CBS 569]|nr:hypothetical protein I317_00604 [Kwoniella heveanensis CBS 569]
MTSTERTPLLGVSATAAGPSRRPRPKVSDSSNQSASPRPVYDASLKDEARALIRILRSSATEYLEGSPLGPSGTDLATHLYALYLLQPRRSRSTSSTTAINSNSIGRKLLKEGADRKIRDIIYEKVERSLDSFEAAEDELGVEEEDERLRRVFWGRRRIDIADRERWVSAIDLLLPPYILRSRPSPFLSHPVVRHMLDHAWSQGTNSPYEVGEEPKSYISRLRFSMARQVTPFRLHALHLISYLVLYSLTLLIALSPGSWITTYTSDNRVNGNRSPIALKEVLWIIWAISNAIHSLQGSYPLPLIQRFFLLPAHLAALFALISPLRHLAYPFVNISIPSLAFLLVLPHPPSVSILIKGLIPLSVLLQRILNRSIRTAGLLMPLVLVLFVIFGWSMNGDVFRGFWALPTLAASSWWTINQNDVAVHRVWPLTITTVDEPIEEGISPFPARVSLFSTLSLLFLFSIILTAARAIMTPKDRWDEPKTGARRWKGGVIDGDDWEREYGLIVGRQARGARAEAVRRYVMLGLPESQIEGDDGGADCIGDVPPAQSDEERGIVSAGSSAATPKPHQQPHDHHHTYTPSSIPTAHILPPPPNILTLPFEIILRLTPELTTCDGMKARLRYSIFQCHTILAAILCLPLMLLGRVIPAVAGSEDDL